MKRHSPKVSLWLLISIWTLLLWSCQEVTFREPQPVMIRPLTEIPEALRGTYETYNRSTGETGDTLIVERWGCRLADKHQNEFLGRWVMGDTLIIKAYKNLYFVNVKEGDQWVLRLIKPKSPGRLELLSIDLQNESLRTKLLAEIKSKLRVNEVTVGENKYYQINPTMAQLEWLMNEDFFRGTELRKVK